MSVSALGLLWSLLFAAARMLHPPPGAAVEAAPAAGGQRLELKAVIERVQKKYDAASDFRARFGQTLTNVAFGRKTSLGGEVLFKKPGRMRWNYTTPEPKSYVADGTTLWLYEPEDKQAFKQDLKGSQLPAALAFLTGQGNLTAEFDVALAGQTTYGGPGDYVLSLSPKQPQSQVKTILFVVDPTTFNGRESVITDGQGNVNDMLFSDIRVNTAIPEATFRFSPPAGTRVIDAAKLGR